MSLEIIFNVQLVLGYVAWLLCFRTYLLPRLKSMDLVAAQRAIATLHSFRFFDWSLSCLALSARIYPLALPGSPPTGTWQPGCWLCWRFSR